MHMLLDQIRLHKEGKENGVFCVCSAHPLVIEASLRQALQDNSILIVEATSNQVDQFGGYTGMTPQDFADFVQGLANEVGFPLERLVLGGDHLGPNRWQKTDDGEAAMAKACDLVAAYVDAGFTKIHLDCSMSCVGDPVPLTDEIVASRAARLMRVAEDTAKAKFGSSDLVYIIGTEVPVPGGAHETINTLEVTSRGAAQKTIQAHQEAFAQAGLSEVWPRVIGLVVQPGVEFDHVGVVDFVPEKAQDLVSLLDQFPHLVYEAHSTDYQNDQAYVDLVKNHFAILKVGPALTFALREALYKLAYIEDFAVPADKRSNLLEVIEQETLAQPGYWQDYYGGTAEEQKFARSYSFSDRIRYYWPNAKIQQAIKTLLANFPGPIPLPFLSQFFPEQFKRIRGGKLANTAKDLLLDSVASVNRVYAAACKGKL
ncbi:D-tagatose-bisphosphate aldolase, class II, non-catalytic subunit [Psittacicella hinzii]|uniref:D-tagatose-bisphosphate aldolase, class II, non-catalytic subunit n=1 Tax=Psittacicella hinzii TaxID=2028575 RepID=A0A3A1YQL4_9GAMM|nr:D-tagatose-bisphosphate aldolase, class II, non-catalytic subunit [Psittacicella hinzii]RIY39240.1 D-tagatose-bisphosphate aldolase, class II, non-catalytic subunit [Psittacicella hinzii]